MRPYPVGFLPVCLAVLCERCAAFMLASSLVLMLCQRYGYPRVEALRLAGLITAAGYLGSLPGGLLADRVLGHRRGLLASLLFLMAAYLLLALPTMAWAQRGTDPVLRPGLPPPEGLVRTCREALAEPLPPPPTKSGRPTSSA